MNRIEIRSIIEEKNEWCISVIIPTHRTSPDRRVDSETLRKSISHAKTILGKKNPPKNIYIALVASIDKLALEFDPVHAMEGLGIFVSPGMARIVHFPFTVKEKIIIDNTFETRDLHYLEQFSRPYYVLKLTKDVARLFLLEAGALIREITNTHFPVRIENEYEYARPTIGTSFGYARKGFEKDKSTINKIRREQFYKNVQQYLMQHIKATDLLITGSKNILSNFEEVRDKRLRVKGRVTGSFKDQHELFTRARNTYFDFRQNEIQTLIESLEELEGSKKSTFGIRNVWSAANAGKGDVLLVEKDFRKVGYTIETNQLLSLQVPLTNHSTLPDVVDQVIETIIHKGGRVVFTEDGQLEKYEQIALILRY